MENEIIAHPAVLEAAVIGLAHPKWKERPPALVILRQEFKGNVNPQDIRSHLGQTFAKWQLPDEVLFVEALSRTSVGKMDKKVLRASTRIYI